MNEASAMVAGKSVPEWVETVRAEWARTGGVLPLRPAYARRFYRDGGRLGLAGHEAGGTLIAAEGFFIPERWIASSVEAVNPLPRKGEGLSQLDLPGEPIAFRDACLACGDFLLGGTSQHPIREFRVLTKILDGAEPIVFHVHAPDKMVSCCPDWFPGHQFGKDEAYYFLEAPKGRYPYTHFGLQQGVAAEDLRRAIARGRDYVAELAPAVHQRFGEGLFTPSGMPHSPGTALTLEIQQPSDVCTLLETRPVFGGGDFTSEQKFQGLPGLEEALQVVDFAAAARADVVADYRIVPEEVCSESGAREDWIFPPRFTAKFSGKRLRLAQGKSYRCREDGPYAVFVWRGQGRLAHHAFQEGEGRDEFFVSATLARSEHVFCNTGETEMEIFKIFPPAMASVGEPIKDTEE